jgi:hypothetical protein
VGECIRARDGALRRGERRGAEKALRGRRVDRLLDGVLLGGERLDLVEVERGESDLPGVVFLIVDSSVAPCSVPHCGQIRDPIGSAVKHLVHNVAISPPGPYVCRCRKLRLFTCSFSTTTHHLQYRKICPLVSHRSNNVHTKLLRSVPSGAWRVFRSLTRNRGKVAWTSSFAFRSP